MSKRKKKKSNDNEFTLKSLLVILGIFVWMGIVFVVISLMLRTTEQEERQLPMQPTYEHIPSVNLSNDTLDFQVRNPREQVIKAKTTNSLLKPHHILLV